MESIAGYDIWAKTYDGFANPMIAMADAALEANPLALSSKRVLELGCGTGRNAASILKAGALSYVGIDASQGMLAKARERYPSLSWLHANLDAPLQIASASVDLVLITLVLEHMPNLSDLFLEIARVLVPGGILRIVEMHPTQMQKGNQAHFWVDGEEIKMQSFAHNSEEFSAVLTEVGLELCTTREYIPSEALIAKIPKLAKHRGVPVILDIEARKIAVY